MKKSTVMNSQEFQRQLAEALKDKPIGEQVVVVRIVDGKPKIIFEPPKKTLGAVPLAPKQPVPKYDPNVVDDDSPRRPNVEVSDHDDSSTPPKKIVFRQRLHAAPLRPDQLESDEWETDDLSESNVSSFSPPGTPPASYGDLPFFANGDVQFCFLPPLGLESSQ